MSDTDFTIIPAQPGYFGLFYDDAYEGGEPDPAMARAIIAWRIEKEFVAPIGVDGEFRPDAIMDPRGIIETEDATYQSYQKWHDVRP